MNRCIRTWSVLWITAVVLGVVLSGCRRRSPSPTPTNKKSVESQSVAQPPSPSQEPAKTPKMTSGPLEVTCTLDRDSAGRLRLQYRMRNTSRETIHVFDSARMPYTGYIESGTLMVTHGFYLPPTDSWVGRIPIRPTRALGPGASLARAVSLEPLILRDHYETDDKPKTLSGRWSIYCQAGWFPRAILSSEIDHIDILELLDLQHAAEAPPLEVIFP
jgi:hypothetical protein